MSATQPVLITVSNAEFAASQGADILVLNLFDVNNPVINGLPKVQRRMITFGQLNT